MKNFRTYQAAVELYQQGSKVKLKAPLKDQYERALLSIVLNLAEGSAKLGQKDRRKFFTIAFGSLREVQACLTVANRNDLTIQTDQLAGSIYKLMQNPGPGPLA
jgi:four helix bundle protein